MQTKESLEVNIGHREVEVAGYQLNVDNYTTMLTIIPNRLSKDLEQYRQRNITDLVSTLSEEELTKLSDAQFRAKIAGTLIVEKLEQRKVQFVLDALKVQLEALCTQS